MLVGNQPDKHGILLDHGAEPEPAWIQQTEDGVSTDPLQLLSLATKAESMRVVGDERAFAYFSTALDGSPHRTYRYALGRQWSSKEPPLVVCMLNPSTADERVVDPTVRKCLHFAARDGFGGLVVVNLSALRSTDPKLLSDWNQQKRDVWGPQNMAVLARICAMSERVVAAWGLPAWKFLHERIEMVPCSSG